MPTTTVEEIEKVETSKSKKSELLLDSLEIKGYRCFKHLTIEKLGRVNLIVGKNNVGKTALLEAISIYINRGNVQNLIHFLETRNEAQRSIEQSSNRSVLIDLSFKTLFTSNSETSHNTKDLSIKGNVNTNAETLLLSFPELRSKDGKLTDIARKLSETSKMFSEDEGAVIEIKYIKEKSGEFDLEYYNVLNNSLFVEKKKLVNFPNVFIKVESLRNNELLILWDDTNKNNLIEYAINAMQLLKGSIKDISFIGVPSGSNNLIPHVGIVGKPTKLPLRRFGDGMTRLLGLSLALSSCRNGILFIDEIETGLHYSILPDVWKLIFKTARDLNVQVFATTHSYDCIEAFAQAAIDDEKSDGMLIRLARKDEQIKAFTFDEKQLETITKEHIEVR
jgi:AAA15 family ATPase/GTPase